MPIFYYKLTVEYDGTLYHGWQKQPHRPTLQDTIERTLLRITGETVKITGAGRTDAGVHALAQVAHFQLKRARDPQRLLLGLNALLPNDIAIKHIEEVDSSFHARYSAKGKTYYYIIDNGPIRSPHQRQIAWHLNYPLHLPRMRAAASRLRGKHDFTSLCAAENDAEDHTVDLKKIIITKKGEEIKITLVATRFLRYMVRNIVGLLVEVGRGRRSVAEMTSLLKAKDRRLAGPTAPPHGLFLVKVEY